MVGGARAAIVLAVSVGIAVGVGVVAVSIVVGIATNEEIEWVVSDAASGCSGWGATHIHIGFIGRGRGGYRVGVGVEWVCHGDGRWL